jgi:hypothetical protein
MKWEWRWKEAVMAYFKALPSTHIVTMMITTKSCKLNPQPPKYKVGMMAITLQSYVQRLMPRKRLIGII